MPDGFRGGLWTGGGRRGHNLKQAAKNIQIGEYSVAALPLPQVAKKDLEALYIFRRLTSKRT